MGFDDMIKDGEQAMDGQDASNQQAQNQSQGSGNDAKEDTVADSAIDEIASKEGMPAGFDPEVNNVVNDEINKM